MDVLLVSSEFAPWVQNSGVAEVVASFSKTLKQVGHSVTVVVPYSIAYEAAGLLLARRLTPLRIEGHGSLTVFDTQLTSGVSLTLVSLGLETNGQNSILAAVLFGRAVAALVKERSELGSRADIVHVHDWFGGLAGLALELLGGSRPPVVLTVYDINQPGMFSLPSESRSLLGPFGDMQQLTVGSELNILAAAMRTASRVTTVSDSYAGLLGNIASSGNVAHVAHELKFPVLGIPGGIDYARFNPAIDPLLVARYDAEDFSQKGTCKTALQRELGLELDLNCPMLLIPGPLTGDTGGQLIFNSLLRLIDQPLSLVVMVQSSDQVSIASAAERLAEQWPKRLALLSMDTSQALHRAISAADFVLLAAQPSPLETRHMLAQRYGALPVAIANGVLADTLVDCDAKLETGYGFLFATPSVEDLTGAVARAVTAWGHAEFGQLRRRTMQRDLSWERPARRMVQVYRQALGTSS